MTDTITVEVAYAAPSKQTILSLSVPVGATAIEAVRASGILTQFPEIDLAGSKIGIFGKAVAPDTVLRASDRVEIYRPLLADPKEVRRRRAEASKK